MNKAMNKVIKSHIFLACITFVAVVLVATGVTYSLFQVDKENTVNQNIAIGNLSAHITSIEGAVVLNDLYPKLSTELTEEDKIYNFIITNDGDFEISYEIYLKDATDSLLASSNDYTEYTRYNSSYYKYVNFIFDEGSVKNLEGIQEEDKFILLSGRLKPGESYDHKIQFFIDKGETTESGAPNDLAGSVLSLDIYMDAAAYDPEAGQNFVQALLAKTNDSSITDYNSGVKGEMFTFSHDATEQTEALTDYRYIGNEPNNYVQFNEETWRIIGVFTVEGENGEKEQRVKIIRDEPIGNFPWDMKEDGTYQSYWLESSLSTMLNGDYVNKGGSFSYTWYKYNYDNSNSPQVSKIQGLNVTAKSQISFAKWYLVGNDDVYNLGGSDYYTFERGTEPCIATGQCSEEGLNMIAKVGLMYPSDYVYTYANGVDNTCYTNGSKCQTSASGTPSAGWLFNSTTQWTISTIIPGSKIDAAIIFGDSAFVVSASGFVTYDDFSQGVTQANNVRPCVYLRSDIKIISGTGAESDPYILNS